MKKENMGVFVGTRIRPKRIAEWFPECTENIQNLPPPKNPELSFDELPGIFSYDDCPYCGKRQETWENEIEARYITSWYDKESEGKSMAEHPISSEGVYQCPGCENRYACIL